MSIKNVYNSFLKVSCNAEFEIILLNFSNCNNKIHWCVLHFERIFYPYIGHVGGISSLNYLDLSNGDIFQ